VSRRLVVVLAALTLCGVLIGVAVVAVDRERASGPASAPGTTVPPPPSNDPVPDAILERFAATELCANPGAPPARTEGKELLGILAIDAGCVNSRFEVVDRSLVQARLADLRSDPSVLSAVVDVGVFDLAVDAGPTKDPRVAEQWAVPRLRMTDAWTRTRGAGAVVGVVDTGVDAGHADLAANISVSRLYDGQTAHEHGTHVAGTVAAVADNGIGVVGIAPEAKLVAITRLAADVHSMVSAAIAIRSTVDRGARVVNLSWTVGSIGGLNRADVAPLEIALRYASRKDALVVMANGNCGGATPATRDCPEGVSTIYWPQVFASMREPWADALVTVGATDREDRLAGFSSHGIDPDVSAPGVGILSTTPGDYAVRDGTSMAAPHVTGVAALVRALSPNLGAPQVAEILATSAEPLTKVDGRSGGAGLVNPVAALVAAAGEAPASTTTTRPRAELPDFTNFTFPAGTCEPGTKAVTVVKGRGGDSSIDPPEIVEVKVSKGDLDGDTVPEALVHVSCSLSGVRAGGREVAQIWSTKGGSAAVVTDVPARTRSFGADATRLRALSLSGRKIDVVEQIWGPEEPGCCSTVGARLSYTFEAGRLRPVGTPTVFSSEPNDPASAFVVGVVEGYGLGEVATDEVRKAIPKEFLGGEATDLSCELAGDITSECNGTIVTKAGVTRRIHLAFAPDLPAGVEYIDGELMRDGKAYLPTRGRVIDFSLR